MSPIIVSEDLKAFIVKMVEKECETRYPRMSLLLQPYATTDFVTDYVTQRLKHFATKDEMSALRRELDLYVRRDMFQRELDAKTRVIVEERIYAYSNTQMGLQSILQKQTSTLKSEAEKIVEEQKALLRTELEKVREKSNDGERFTALQVGIPIFFVGVLFAHYVIKF